MFIKEFVWVYFPKAKVIRLICALILLVGFLIIYFFLNLPDGKLHIFFMDVGQGDSIFIRTPHGQKALIDGGPDEKVLAHLGEILPFYDRSLDLVVLTHSHADHITGLIEVIERYQVDQILANKTGYQTPETEEFWKVVENRGVRVENLTMGEIVKIGKIEFDCFWPPQGRVETGSSNPNLDSIVLRLKYGGLSVLLTGDAEDVVQEQLILLGKMPPVTAVFKVPHQGAEDSCDEEFTKKLNPQLAIISVGRNRFGHPSEKTMNLLKNLNIEALRTDQNGTIEVISDGEKWWFHPSRGS
jgi:competence protein ComEC